MQLQYDPFLEPAAQGPFEMEQSSVPRSYKLDSTDGKDLDDWYTVPSNAEFVLGYQYPSVPSFTEDFADASYFTPQHPKQFGIGFSYSPAEGGTPPSVQRTIGGSHLLDADMGLDDRYIFRGSYQPIEAPLASPSDMGSPLDSSPWESVYPVQHEAVWDLPPLHPDSCSISAVGSLNWSGASTPESRPQQHSLMEDKQKEAAALLKISLGESFRYPCGYKTCTKTFKRKEHAKRHYLTSKQSRLQCEFCGKDTFTRTDNLNAHRRLHARQPPKHNSGVHFVPAALEVFKRRKKASLHLGQLLHLAA
ncbi:hypothetical protein FANTH_13832 [Fusarium anthophilum]|uniref:C2H2-type domain-containing protein n=1 Tax=Fusarium anthophilum TaxID=48485 RepID=A0A8H4YM86_9HYPO|nr:hypothetical protein FANTH_13832 [Fusarium anthophilum]